jgi:transcriptional regulator with XRE-family HTH domain
MEEIFDLTLKRYGIQGKALANLSGVSENHISEFRRGKLKTGVTTDCLLKLLEAMDQLSPGARRFFCDLLAGKKKLPQGFQSELEFLIDAADENELESAMLQIVARMFPKSEEDRNRNSTVERLKSPIHF